MTTASLLWSWIFRSIGLGYFSYGKKANGGCADALRTRGGGLSVFCCQHAIN